LLPVQENRIHDALVTSVLKQCRTDPVRVNRPDGSSSKGIILPQMTLSSGNRLGPYEILGPLGVGGMGEVYRARDAKLGRNVALKVLPAAFARDGERMARFEREAKVLASLNHPNIASIYGLEDSGATHALVMELVEGLTLADRLRSGPIPIDDALLIARQICEALEYAHERGIVHRDLKPANVKLTKDDAVKVLDFGLAKAAEGDAASVDIATSPTIGQMATQAGVLLGTPAYMAPEQARGKVVDRRADIWAFGCFLYEMITGKMAFRGETVTDTLAAVIRSEPDWSVLPSTTPIRIRVLLQRCLLKDPKRRLRDIGEARIAIDEVLDGAPDSSSLIGENPSSSAELLRPKISVPDTAARSKTSSAAIWVAVVAVALLSLAGGYWAHTLSERSNAQRAPAIAAPALPTPDVEKPSVEKPGTQPPAKTPHPIRPAGGPAGVVKAATPHPTAPLGPAQPGARVAALPASSPPPAAVATSSYDGTYSGPVCYGKTQSEPERCYSAEGAIRGDRITGQWTIAGDKGITMFMTGDVAASGDVKIEMHSQKADGAPVSSIDLTGTLHDGQIDASGRFRRGRKATLNWHKNSRASD
jgi:serine/threonine protein kinase